MRYEKPEVILMGNASETIRHCPPKVGLVSDSEKDITCPAYEADE